MPSLAGTPPTSSQRSILLPHPKRRPSNPLTAYCSRSSQERSRRSMRSDRSRSPGSPMALGKPRDWHWGAVAEAAAVRACPRRPQCECALHAGERYRPLGSDPACVSAGSRAFPRERDALHDDEPVAVRAGRSAWPRHSTIRTGLRRGQDVWRQVRARAHTGANGHRDVLGAARRYRVARIDSSDRRGTGSRSRVGSALPGCSIRGIRRCAS
jgi:hypothetical protein